MTHGKITMKTNPQTGAGVDVAALADQLIQDNWHLPPGGDQSWREEDARRIFSGDGKDAMTDREEPANETFPPADETTAPPQPGFKSPGVFGMGMAVSLALFVMLGAVVFSMPELLTADFWNRPGAAITPARMISTASAAPVPQAAGPGRLRPSLANEGSVPVVPGRMAAVPAARHQPASAVSPEKADVRTAEMRQFRHAPARGLPGMIRVAGAKPLRRSQPPIGEAYFAGRSPESRKLAAASPIGEAYFASHASADWKAKSAQWDELASPIWARSEQYRREENGAEAEPGARSSSEFP